MTLATAAVALLVTASAVSIYGIVGWVGSKSLRAWEKGEGQSIDLGEGKLQGYLDNPNGSANDIAGITNERGNVVGLMPHPEHNVEELTGSSLDGKAFFESVLQFLALRV